MHAIAAKWIPELHLEHEESKALAEAINDVQQFYGYEASAEVLLWMNVFGVASGIYGPRIGAFVINRKMKTVVPKPAPAPKHQDNVVHFVNVEGVDMAHHAPEE
jgi:hypothetical protein